MKKFLVSLVMLVVTTLGAHAQFEKDVWYVNASLTGLDSLIVSMKEPTLVLHWEVVLL